MRMHSTKPFEEACCKFLQRLTEENLRWSWGGGLCVLEEWSGTDASSSDDVPGNASNCGEVKSCLLSGYLHITLDCWKI